MSLKQLIIDDISDVFYNADDFAVAITYTRGSQSAELTAIVGEDISEQFTQLGATRVEVRSFQIEASTLDLGDGVTLPQIGDTITDGDSVYVVPKSNSIPRWSYVDQDRLILNVNTTLRGPA